MSVRVDPETGELIEERPLRTAGGSTVLTIPPDILRQAGLAAGEEVEVAVDARDEGRIEIRTGDGGEGGENA